MAEQKQPSLGGQFDAWIRQGAKDLHNAVVPAFPSSQRGVDEPGTPLNPTQQMVTEGLEGQRWDATLDQYATRGKEAERQAEMER